MNNFNSQLSDGVTFEIAAVPFINYAAALNGWPVVQALRVTPSADLDLQNVAINCWITSQGHNLSSVWTREIGSLDSAGVIVDDVSFHFDSELLLQQTESHPVELRLSIESETGFLAQVFWNLELQSPDSWSFSLESQATLAAFVQPQHPAVREILNNGLEILRERGLSPSWSGYQDPEHVAYMVRAIYQAVVDLGVAYSDPPASWDLVGQRIRSAQRITQEKVATCLDTAVLFASALEAVGLMPLISLIPQHAFVGYWTPLALEENVHASNPVRTIASAINLIDLKFIELFETTCICEGQVLDYDDAISESYARMINKNVLSENAEQGTLVDIAACRTPGPRSVHPLPARYIRADGSVEIAHYKPIELTPAMLKDRLSSVGVSRSALSAASIDAPPVVKRWLDSLLDLSLRNPLINFRESKSAIPLVTVPESLGLIEDLLQQEKPLSIRHNEMVTKSVKTGLLAPADILSDRGQVLPNAQIDNKGTTLENYVSSALNSGAVISNLGKEANVAALRKMASSAKTFFEETGSNGLYLALGSLVWTPKDREPVRSPLVLVPVRLIARNRSRDFELAIDPTGQVTPNYSLAEKLLRDEKIVLDKLVDLEADESGVNIAKTFSHVREVLSRAGIEDFRVDENAVLGFFNFSTYRLWQDLVDNWQKFAGSNALVRHLVETPTSEFSGNPTTTKEPDLDAILSRLPISADSSQALAISEALVGKTFVLQGPPGTGKSQTITNLLALALSEGKKVLFVAEKKDALDVVKDRLDKAGLGAFSLDLHDKGMTPKSVREQLLSVMDISVEDDKVGFENAVREYENAILPLKAYRNRLHEIGSQGESLYSALDNLLATPSQFEIEIPGEFIANNEPGMRSKLYEAARTVSTFGLEAGNSTQNAWSLSTLGGKTESEAILQIANLASKLAHSLEVIKTNPEVKEYLANVSSVKEFALVRALALPESELPVLTDDVEQVKARAQAKVDLQSLVDEIVSTGIDLIKLDSVDADAWLGQAQIAQTSIKLFRNSRLNSVKKKLGILLGQTLGFQPDELIGFLSKLRNIKRRALQLRNDLTQIRGYRFDVTSNLFDLKVSKALLSALGNFDLVAELGSFKHDSGPQSSALGSLRKSEEIQELVALVPVVATLFQRLSANDESLQRWMDGRKFGYALVTSIPAWHADCAAHGSSSLTRWATLLGEVRHFEDVGIYDFGRRVLSGEVPFDAAPAAFQRGYFKALLDNLVHERGFNTFDSMAITNAIEKLDSSQHHIRQRLPRILASQLLSRRGFDSSTKTGSVSDLYGILKAPRSKMQIRPLLKRFWPEITRVTPCVLASPDSVVRFIDPTVEPFDLVIFDEASQIRVANSIGALGRGKASVIVGDSNQMPPTSVAQVKSNGLDGDDLSEYLDDVTFEKDSESILSLASDSNVPSVMLKWHYRSEDESLIAFSNKKYYRNELTTFPSPSPERVTKGLSFTHVPNGVFVRPGMTGAGRRGTNPAEIDEIIKDLAKRLKNPDTANESVGIVTFNKEQMEEIKLRLLDSKDQAIQRALQEGVGGEEIFVKNLETVQGSERDVILFSVAFSTNEEGVLPLNFGPLGQQGGHRRLNVAITRARKQVRVFCSFLPEQLLSRKPSAPGILHLGEFLSLAQKNAEVVGDTLRVREPRIDRHRRDIATHLRQAGLTVIEEVGLSDFKVDIAIADPKTPEVGVLAILLDGPRWNSRRSVSDRDLLPVEQLLRKKGWPAVERIWVASWLRDPEGEISRIVNAFERAKEMPNQTRVDPQGPQEPVYRVSTASDRDPFDPMASLLTETPAWEPLVLVDGTQIDRSFLDNLSDPRVVEVVRLIADKLTAKEGPISGDRLGKYVAKCFGFDRVPAERVVEINSIPLPGHHRDDEGFIFPINQSPQQYTLWRHGSGGLERTLQDISLAELSSAMRSVVKVALRLREEMLAKETSRIFGIQKVSSATDVRLQAAAKFGIETGKLKLLDGYFEPAD